MMSRAALIVALAVATAPLAAHSQSQLQSRVVYDGDTTTRTAKGKAQPLHVSVRFWELTSGAGLQAVPLRGFCLARAVGGDVRTVIDGLSVDRAPEDLWVVPAGSAMQIQAINEFASIETIAVGPAHPRRPRLAQGHARAIAMPGRAVGPSPVGALPRCKSDK